MQPFASLLERLLYTPQRNAKIALLVDYFRSVPDPDRGFGLAALADGFAFANAKPSMVRTLATKRTDPALFAWSYDFVGDLAETTALIWPQRPSNRRWPSLAEVIETLNAIDKRSLPDILEIWLDTLDANGRWALLKLVTGSLRIGVSARLTKLALAQYGDKDPAEIEEVWHGIMPPYPSLFAWLDGEGDKPSFDTQPVFRPLMLAHPLEYEDIRRLDIKNYSAEWKWDGIRVQLAVVQGQKRLYSRTGDEIGGSFPDILEAMNFEGVLDGELLIVRNQTVGSFNDLQQRLGRKAPTTKLIEAYPAFVHLYDILFDNREDLRNATFTIRRKRLERFFEQTRPTRMDVPPVITFETQEDLERLRASCRGTEREGLMLKRLDSVYVAGRPKGPWFKWKRDALSLDTVLMYAQRGHGRRSSFYSDFTFGAWRNNGPRQDDVELVPVGKAYFGFTDEELRQLDRWVRNHTTNRFGPVREVEPALVLEIAFDSVHRSTRHKSGVAMRFPRINRIRWDKPADEADRLEQLERLIE
ncbi:MAG: cisplatin damage response ATP-dependent DNA ligase [Cyanobacteria bacterium J06638_22]